MKPRSLPSRLFDRNPAEALNVRAAKYQRHMDCADHQESLHQSGHSSDNGRQNDKCHREIHFAFLPERYEPLVDDETQVKPKGEKKKRKEMYKKVQKNVGKALRSTWKCLKLGLYNFALGYSTPITVAATFVPDFHPGRRQDLS